MKLHFERKNLEIFQIWSVLLSHPVGCRNIATRHRFVSGHWNPSWRKMWRWSYMYLFGPSSVGCFFSNLLCFVTRADGQRDEKTLVVKKTPAPSIRHKWVALSSFFWVYAGVFDPTTDINMGITPLAIHMPHIVRTFVVFWILATGKLLALLQVTQKRKQKLNEKTKLDTWWHPYWTRIQVYTSCLIRFNSKKDYKETFFWTKQILKQAAD